MDQSSLEDTPGQHHVCCVYTTLGKINRRHYLSIKHKTPRTSQTSPTNSTPFFHPLHPTNQQTIKERLIMAKKKAVRLKRGQKACPKCGKAIAARSESCKLKEVVDWVKTKPTANKGATSNNSSNNARANSRTSRARLLWRSDH